jgi:hypothetical protein
MGGNDMRAKHTLTLSPVKHIACGADLLNVQRETEWLERVNASTEAQIALANKAKAYAKFKPRPKAVAYVAPEILPEREPVERGSKWSTQRNGQGGSGKALALGYRPKRWVSSYVNGSKIR